MRFKDRIAAEQKAAQALVAKGEDSLTDEEFEELKGHYDEIKKLREQEALFKGATDELNSMAAASKPKAQAKAARTIGEHYMNELKEAGLSILDTKKTPFESTEFKAATDTQATGGADGAYKPILTEVDQQGVFPYQRPLTVADLFSQGSMTGNAVTYPVYGKLEGGPDTVAEGGQKPQSHFPDPEWVTDTLKEVAVWWKITDDMAEDLPYVASEIQDQNDYAMQLKEEDQLLNGDGSGSNVKGLLARDGVQEIAADDERTVADRIFHAKTMINKATGHNADALVISPDDYEALRLAKDANQQYYGGGFFLPAYGGTGQLVIQETPWGLKTVVTPAAPDGECYVGAFKAGGKVLRKGGRRVASTNSHEDDFTNDKVTFRIKERMTLQVKYPADFVKVSTEAASGTTGATGATGDTGATGQALEAEAAAAKAPAKAASSK